MNISAILKMLEKLRNAVILERGIIKTPSLSEYLVPTAMDVPEVQMLMIESGDGVGPFGAKRLGEPSACSVARAIANAIYDAVGVRIYDLPMTPERTLKAIKSRGKSK